MARVIYDPSVIADKTKVKERMYTPTSGMDNFAKGLGIVNALAESPLTGLAIRGGQAAWNGLTGESEDELAALAARRLERGSKGLDFTEPTGAAALPTSNQDILDQARGIAGRTTTDKVVNLGSAPPPTNNLPVKFMPDYAGTTGPQGRTDGPYTTSPGIVLDDAQRGMDGPLQGRPTGPEGVAMDAAYASGMEDMNAERVAAQANATTLADLARRRLEASAPVVAPAAGASSVADRNALHAAQWDAMAPAYREQVNGRVPMDMTTADIPGYPGNGVAAAGAPGTGDGAAPAAPVSAAPVAPVAPAPAPAPAPAAPAAVPVAAAPAAPAQPKTLATATTAELESVYKSLAAQAPNISQSARRHMDTIAEEIRDRRTVAESRVDIDQLRAEARAAGTNEQQVAVLGKVGRARAPALGVSDLFSGAPEERLAKELAGYFPQATDPAEAEWRLATAAKYRAEAATEEATRAAEVERKRAAANKGNAQAAAIAARVDSQIAKDEAAAKNLDSQRQDRDKQTQPKIDKMRADIARLNALAAKARRRPGGGSSGIGKDDIKFAQLFSQERGAMVREAGAYAKNEEDAAEKEALLYQGAELNAERAAMGLPEEPPAQYGPDLKESQAYRDYVKQKAIADNARRVADIAKGNAEKASGRRAKAAEVYATALKAGEESQALVRDILVGGVKLARKRIQEKRNGAPAAGPEATTPATPGATKPKKPISFE